MLFNYCLKSRFAATYKRRVSTAVKWRSVPRSVCDSPSVCAVSFRNYERWL